MNKLFSLGKVIKDLHRNNFSNAYFLYGDDIFMQDYFIKEFKKIKSASQAYLYYLGYDQPDMIFNELSNVSLFDSNKIIIVKNINRFSNKAKQDLMEYLLKDNSDNHLILVRDEFDYKNKFIDSIIQNTIAIDVRTPFENKMLQWVKYFSKLEGINIENQHIQNYVESYGSSISNVMNYIKIDFLSKKKNFGDSNRQYHLWHLQDAIGRKEMNKSIDIFKSLLINGNSANMILIYLFHFYYFMYCFNPKEAIKASYNFSVNKIIKSKMNIYSNKHHKNEIENIILQITKLDFLSKNSSIDINNRILCLINNICMGHYGQNR